MLVKVVWYRTRVQRKLTCRHTYDVDASIRYFGSVLESNSNEVAQFYGVRLCLYKAHVSCAL